MTAKPKLAVWKFASCDGCQLTLLDCEDELLAIADAIDIAYFPEATRRHVEGPYDLSLVEGSVATSEDLKRIQQVRTQSKYLITIGACATSGGIQALRNYRDANAMLTSIYAHPEYIDSLATCTPIAEHVPVDFELRGCPIDKMQLIETISAFLYNRRPAIRSESVCMECKRQHNSCVMVSDGIPCLGPVTQAGCGALCPTYKRGCYGCFGPARSANMQALLAEWDRLGVSKKRISQALQTFNANAPDFREAAETYEHADN